VLGEFPGKEEPDRGLDLSGGDGRPLVVVSQTTGLAGDPLEQVVDERVHDGHGLGADPGVGMNLLEDLVDVDGVRLLSLGLASLLVTLGDGLGSLSGFLNCFSGSLRRHIELGQLQNNNSIVITNDCLLLLHFTIYEKEADP
jgi:hypothetical protein